MNIFNMDVRKHIPQIIDAYTEVFGAENRKLIGERINGAYYVSYKDLDGVKSYRDFLLECESRELFVEFLNKIGVETERYEKETFAEELDDKLNKIRGWYIDRTAFLDTEDKERPLYGVMPFFMEYEDKSEAETARINKINFLNYLREKRKKEQRNQNGEAEGQDHISEEEYGESYEEDDYAYIDDWNFDDFCQTEEFRQILEELEIARQAYEEIREKYLEYARMLDKEYGAYIQEGKRIEKELNAIKDSDARFRRKREINYNSRDFQANFGNNLFSKTDKEIANIAMLFKKTATIPMKMKRGKSEVVFPVVLYGAREDFGGSLDQLTLHEVCHVLGINGNMAAFDKLGTDQKNPYKTNYRKYERLNENFTDMLTIEALESLRKKGIYLFEDKKHAKTKWDNLNTSAITKKMLQPLMEKFRVEILQVMLGKDPHILISKIGEDNFEELNDIINKVDSLCIDGLQKKLDNGENKDNLVLEYKRQLARMKKLYASIDRSIADKNRKGDNNLNSNAKVSEELDGGEDR